MKNMNTLKTGLMVAAIASIASIGSAQADHANRNAFAMETIAAHAANQASQAQKLGYETAATPLDLEIIQLSATYNVESGVENPGIIHIDIFENTISAPNAGLGDSTGTNVFGAGYGSNEIDMTQIETKTNPTVIVPLPTSAIAGMGMLLSFAGIRYMRTRK